MEVVEGETEAGGGAAPTWAPPVMGGGLGLLPRPSSESCPAGPASVHSAGGQRASEQGRCWSRPACQLGRGSSAVRPPPDAAPARRVITAGPQPRPGLKGHSTAQQPTSLPASLLFGLPWGYAAPSGPRSNEALLLTKQQLLHTQRDGGSGPSLLQLDYFKVPPPPLLPPSDTPIFSPLCPATRRLPPLSPLPLKSFQWLPTALRIQPWLLHSAHKTGKIWL